MGIKSGVGAGAGAAALLFLLPSKLFKISYQPALHYCFTTQVPRLQGEREKSKGKKEEQEGKREKKRGKEGKKRGEEGKEIKYASSSWMWKLSPGKLSFPRTWNNIEMDIFKYTFP